MAQEETFTIDQGADVAIELHLVNKDGSKKNLGNHSIAAKMKRNYTSDSDETTAFNAIVVSPPEDGAPSSGGLTTMALKAVVSSLSLV